MKNISTSKFIIPGKLASFIYVEDKNIDIFHLLLNQWNDTEYLFKFYTRNETIIKNNQLTRYGYTFTDFSEDIMLALEQLENFIGKLGKNSIESDNYFKSLDNEEEKKKILPLKKRQWKWLRVYAIKIDHNLYAITGGAIKITLKMQDHKDTRNELAQLNYTRDWLKDKGIITSESFYLEFDL